MPVFIKNKNKKMLIMLVLHLVLNYYQYYDGVLSALLNVWRFH